jgi:16S rRNA (cytosine1402-N4)-methyltransferase
MRMDNRESRTAADLVNELSEDMLFRIIREYGEEPHARAIARAIVEHRPYSTTDQLAGVIERTIGRRGKHHPATRTFQALRIALNRELELLEQTLPVLVRLLAPNGRLAVISFRSLEDRIVKRFFAEHTKVGYESDLVDLTKKPISGATEDVNNPRARSAKLRAVANKK